MRQRAERLLAAIGQIHDGHICEADEVRFEKAGARRRRAWLAWAATGAVTAVAAIVLLLVWGNRPAPRVPDAPYDPAMYAGLPKIEVVQDLGTFGFEGYMAYDVKELEGGSPWKEGDRIASMPVYRNTIEYDGAGVSMNGMDTQQMLDRANELAALMNVAVEEVYTHPTEEEMYWNREKGANYQGEEPYLTIAECEGGITIEVERSGQASISFSGGAGVPDEFRVKTQDRTLKQSNGLAAYLLEKYKVVLAMEDPKADVVFDYSYDGTPNGWIEGYEGAGDTIEARIVNAGLNRASFYIDGDGFLSRISMQRQDLSERIGDYPILSAQEARAALLDGRYITTVGEAFPGAQHVASVELMYRSGRFDRVFMPYYRFLVELPTLAQENGLKCYGAYYVPAVRGEFLEGMPVYDGRFN